MDAKRGVRFVGGLGASVVGLAAAGYSTWVVMTWLRYGRVAPPARAEDRDALLDRFMPTYEIAERHHVRVDAPASITFSAAAEMGLTQSVVVRGIFKARELHHAQPFCGAIDDGTLHPADEGHRLGYPGRGSRPRDRDGRCYAALAGRCRFPGAAACRVRGVSRTRLREDRVDVAGRSGRRCPLDLPHRNTCGDNGPDITREIPTVLVACLTGHRPDSMAAARACEGGGAAACPWHPGHGRETRTRQR